VSSAGRRDQCSPDAGVVKGHVFFFGIDPLVYGSLPRKIGIVPIKTVIFWDVQTWQKSAN
jgi:hypothetical protein